MPYPFLAAGLSLLARTERDPVRSQLGNIQLAGTGKKGEKMSPGARSAIFVPYQNMRLQEQALPLG